MTRPFPTQGLLTTSIVLAAALPALAQGKPNHVRDYPMQHI